LESETGTLTPAKLKKLRKSMHMSQAEFWTRIGITQSGGSRYEAGRNIPSPAQLLIRLAYGNDAESRTIMERLRAR